MSGTEGQEPGGTDPIDLQLPRGATGSGREQSASFLGWKWSFLIAVRAISKPLHEGLKKIEDNMNQDFPKSRLSTEDLEFSDQACTLPALLFKDEACAYVRSAEDGNGYQAWQAFLRGRTARNATHQNLLPSETLPPAVPQNKYRCGFLRCTLFERDGGRWRASSVAMRADVSIFLHLTC